MRIQRGIIRRFDPATWQADVELVGAPTALLPGVPVASDLGPALVSAGSKVWLCLSEEGNPADGAVLAPYGAVPPPWVTSRLWKPTVATAERMAVVTCGSTSFVNVTDLAVSLTLETAGTVLLLLAANGYICNSGMTYTLAFYHDDAHETTQLTPYEAVGGTNAAVNEAWSLSWLGLQTAIAAGTHTFVLKHKVSSGQGVLQRGRIVAIAMA